MCSGKLFCGRDGWMWADEFQVFAHSHICQANPDWCGEPWEMLPIQENGSGDKLFTKLLPTALRAGGRNAETGVQVYFGIRNAKRVYVGISNDTTRRGAEHVLDGRNFDELHLLTRTPVARGEARAIEQALIRRNPHFENMRNEIGLRRDYYDAAVEWGESWLRANGL